LRSLVLLATAGVAILGVSVISTLFGQTKAFGTQADRGTRWLITIGTIAIITSMLTVLFRLATTRDHAFRNALPGAFTFAVLWQTLQYFGTLYVNNVIKATSGMNGTFALVLGLMGFIYIAAVMGVLSIEVNVVIARHLWPRALLTPFTDRVDLTEADRRAYAGYALMQRHKGFETVSVTFDGRDGHTHEIVMDPSWLQKNTRKIRAQVGDQLGRPAPEAGYAPDPLGESLDRPSTKVAPWRRPRPAGPSGPPPSQPPRGEAPEPPASPASPNGRPTHLRGVPNDPAPEKRQRPSG
jgi:hypothetical protein